VADAIGNRTRSARGTLPPPQSQNGDTVGAQRAFVTQDSGPMASRISALPTGLVDARMYELDLNEIDMDRRVHLSRGAVSDVYKVRWCGVSAVLKQWHPSCDAERFKNEVDITRLCQFPRVVQLYGASLSQKVMLFERLGRGNLRQVLTSEKYTLASIERHLRTWALEVAEAMAFVHANGVIHYDLKSQNVLVTMSWNTRLCDFSHSVYVGTTPPATAAAAARSGARLAASRSPRPRCSHSASARQRATSTRSACCCGRCCRMARRHFCNTAQMHVRSRPTCARRSTVVRRSSRRGTRASRTSCVARGTSTRTNDRHSISSSQCCRAMCVLKIEIEKSTMVWATTILDLVRLKNFKMFCFNKFSNCSIS
jgi:serine/threonine protein kinase